MWTRRTFIRAAGAGALIIPAYGLIQPQEAFAAIGTPVTLGSTQSSGVTSLVTTSTANAVTAGDTIIVGHYCSTGNRLLTGITDSAGNAYSAVTGWAGQNVIEVWFCPNALAMAGGSGITYSFASTAANHVVQALTVSGLNTAGGSDAKVMTASLAGSTTSTAATTPTLFTPVELVLGITAWQAAPGTVTPGGSFSLVGTINSASLRMQFAYQIVAAITAVTYQPTWVNSVTSVNGVGSFYGPLGGGLLLRGVGN